MGVWQDPHIYHPTRKSNSAPTLILPYPRKINQGIVHIMLATFHVDGKWVCSTCYKRHINLKRLMRQLNQAEPEPKGQVIPPNDEISSSNGEIIDDDR